MRSVSSLADDQLVSQLAETRIQAYPDPTWVESRDGDGAVQVADVNGTATIYFDTQSQTRMLCVDHTGCYQLQGRKEPQISERFVGLSSIYSRRRGRCGMWERPALSVSSKERGEGWDSFIVPRFARFQHFHGPLYNTRSSAGGADHILRYSLSDA